jgi:hypothetical protein
MHKTGTTSQIAIDETETIDGVAYAPGVYRSHNFNDVLPARPEFSICGDSWAFVANSLDEALRMWAEAGAPGPVENVGRLG